MKLKDLYLEAARRVAEGEETFSCHAVARVKTSPRTNYEPTSQVLAYRKVFSPGRGEAGFLCEVNAAMNHDEKRAQNFRVLMLCLMAECWKDFR